MAEKALCDDSEASSMQRAAVLEKYGLLRSFCALHAVLLGACAGALVMATYMIGMEETRSTDFAVCMRPLGGGPVAPGNFPLMADYYGYTCIKTRRQYLVKQYDDDVETAISAAWQFLSDYNGTVSSSYVAVFDIDETSLSNRAEWLQPAPAVGAETVETSMDKYSTSNNPFLPGHLRGHAVSAAVSGPQAGAPPLKPTLKLYRELYRMGFSVTFITGRTGTEQARKDTAQNLLEAGYGAPCPDNPLRSTSPARAHADSGSGALQGFSSNRKLKNEPAPIKQAPAAGEEEPCYVQLGMREEGDMRLASVYKPEKRGKLVEAGFSILACFGDQWSDLSGPHAGLASFILPNPFYYLL